MDERDFNQRVLQATDDAIKREILEGVKDEAQRAMLEDTMRSSAWKMSELVLAAADAERKAKTLEAQAEEGRRAIEERDKAIEKRHAAENARAAAERVAEQERFARISAEDELEQVKREIVRLQEQPSRLAKLREELGV